MGGGTDNCYSLLYNQFIGTRGGTDILYNNEIYITIYYVLYRGGGQKFYLVRTQGQTHTQTNTQKDIYKGGAHLNIAVCFVH